MRITVNGREEQVDEGTRVSGLVQRYGLRPEHIAVEVNLDLVPRRTYASTVLREGDQVEIVTLVGGG